MMAVWVAQAMWWVAQAMWWEGCAGYVAVPGTFYIHSVVQLAILANPHLQVGPRSGMIM